LRYIPTCNRRHNQNRVAILQGSIRPIDVTNILVVDVNVDEVPQRVLIVEEMASQFAVRRRQLIESFSRRRGVNLNFGLATGELPQWRWDDNGDWHDAYLEIVFPLPLGEG
jgi:hypothetical protein